MGFQEFLQGVFTIGFNLWPVAVFGAVVVVLDLMDGKDRQRGKL